MVLNLLENWNSLLNGVVGFFMNLVGLLGTSPCFLFGIGLVVCLLLMTQAVMLGRLDLWSWLSHHMDLPCLALGDHGYVNSILLLYFVLLQMVVHQSLRLVLIPMLYVLPTVGRIDLGGAG